MNSYWRFVALPYLLGNLNTSKPGNLLKEPLKKIFFSMKMDDDMPTQVFVQSHVNESNDTWFVAVTSTKAY